MEVPERTLAAVRSPQALTEWLSGFRALMDAAPDAMLVVARDGTVMLSNQPCEQLFGYSSEELVGHSVEILLPARFRHVHEDHRKDYHASPAKRMMGKGGDYVARRRDGSEILVEISLSPQDTPAGHLVVCAIRDISERRRAEKALQYRDAILQSVAFAAESFLKSGIWGHCIDSVLQSLGQAAEVSRVYVFENRSESGRARLAHRHEWTAPGVDRLSDEAELPWTGARWTRRLSSGNAITGSVADFPEREASAIRHLGVRSCVVVPVFAGDRWWGVIGFDECSRDREWTETEIEALRVAGGTLGAAVFNEQNSRALRESEERFSRVFHRAPMAIRITRLSDDRIINVNDSYTSLTGFHREEMLGSRTVSLGLHVRPQLYRRLLSLVRSDGYYSNQEIQIRSRSGEIRDVISSAVVVDIGGEHCVLSMFYDITARKRLERELMQSSDGEQRQLGYWLHEDLAQQMASVALMCGILLQKLEEEGSPHAQAMRRVCQMLGDAVTSSRTVSRRLSPVDVRSEGLMYALRSLAEQTEKIYAVPCRFASREDVHIADNDVATYLYRIAQDTIANLMKHSSTGGIVIELRREEGQGVLRIRNVEGAPAQRVEEEIELESMRYRAGIIGASVDVRMGSRNDTVIECFFTL